MENAFVVKQPLYAAENRFARIIETEQGQVVLIIDHNQEEDTYELIAWGYSNGAMLITKTGFRVRENAIQVMENWNETNCRDFYELITEGQ